jgi:predicted amidophosphoribosyltransferase
MANINQNKVLELSGKRLQFGCMKENPTAPAQAQQCPNCGHKQDNPPEMNCEDCAWPLQVEDDSDFYEVNDDPEPRRYRLVDEGQTWNGEGESYAERNA